MASNRLGYVALGAFSLFLYGCPVPVDMSETGGMGGTASGGSGGSSGRGGSGSGGSTGGSSGGSSGGASGGTGGSASGGTGGSSGGSGGSTGGSGDSTGGSGGNRDAGTGGTGGGAGGSTGGSTGGGTGDGGGMEAPSAMGTKLPPAIATIFMMRCGTCHMDGGMSRYGDATRAYNALKAMAPAPCSRARMTPPNGAGSLVIQAMKGMKPCGNNMRMPPQGTAVPAADIMAVEEWINMGAKPVP